MLTQEFKSQKPQNPKPGISECWYRILNPQIPQIPSLGFGNSKPKEPPWELGIPK